MTRNELTKLWAKVTGKFNALIDGAPEALDTLKEIADKLGDDDDALAGLLTQVGAKQDALVSGQNIKSINGQSVLGEGNLELGELFVVTMTRNNSVYTADKSVSEIYEASYTNGKPVIAVMRDISNPVFILTDCDPDADGYVFSAIKSNSVTTLRWQHHADDYTYELETIALQPHLVSGTNIKTLNNESLLGVGNVTIKPSDLTFTITQSGTTYTADKTFAEIQAAIRSGATVMGAFDYGRYMVLLSLVGQSVDSIFFAALYGSQVIAFLISASAVTRVDLNLIDSDELATVTGVRVVANWITTAMIGSMYAVTDYDSQALVNAYNANRYIQLTFQGGEWSGVTCFCGGYYISGSDKVFVFTAWQSANLLFVELYPSGVVSVTALNVAAKADKTLATTDIPATGLLPNVVYNYGTTDTVSVTLAAGDAGVANIWCFVFTAQTAACTVTMPSGVVLGNEYAWDMVAGRRYEVSIMDNVAIVNYSD